MCKCHINGIKEELESTILKAKIACDDYAYVKSGEKLAPNWELQQGEGKVAKALLQQGKGSHLPVSRQRPPSNTP